MEEANASLLGSDFSWAPGKFRIVQTKGLPETDVLEGEMDHFFTSLTFS